MFRQVPRPVLFGLLVLVLMTVGAGIGCGLAVVSERISGLPIGYVSAAIGGVVCAVGSILWGLGELTDLFGLADVFTAVRIPPRPDWLPPDKEEEV